MGARVHLHVGLQKSGTTYLQHAWAGRLDELAAAGRRYPVEPGSRSEVPNHQLAFYGLVPDEFGWLAERGSDYAASWRWLQGELARAATPLLLSAEALSTIRAAGAQTVATALGGGLDVLVTARRLDLLLASSWQQSVRNGRGTGFDEYLSHVREHRAQLLADPADSAPNLAWRAFSVGALVRRWSGLTGVASVCVVVNSGHPAELLWERMLEAIGLAPDTVTPLEVADTQTNEGLRWAEADILAALNRALSGPGWDQAQATAVRQAVIRNGFGDRRSRGPSVSLPPEWQDEVAAWAKDDVREIETAGCRVVGPLADLLAAPEETQRSTVVDLTGSDYSEAAAAALLGVMAQSAPEVKSHVLKRALQSVRRAAS